MHRFIFVVNVDPSGYGQNDEASRTVTPCMSGYVVILGKTKY